MVKLPFYMLYEPTSSSTRWCERWINRLECARRVRPTCARDAQCAYANFWQTSYRHVGAVGGLGILRKTKDIRIKWEMRTGAIAGRKFTMRKIWQMSETCVWVWVLAVCGQIPHTFIRIWVCLYKWFVLYSCGWPISLSWVTAHLWCVCAYFFYHKYTQWGSITPHRAHAKRHKTWKSAYRDTAIHLLARYIHVKYINARKGCARTSQQLKSRFVVVYVRQMKWVNADYLRILAHAHLEAYDAHVCAVLNWEQIAHILVHCQTKRRVSLCIKVEYIIHTTKIKGNPITWSCTCTSRQSGLSMFSNMFK